VTDPRATPAHTPDYTTDEMMAVAAARRLRDGAVCFVGIGLPSTAANLARLTHAPNAVLIYEAGPIGAKPTLLPLSIGDGELAETADTVVSTPEIFRYYLQGGRIDVGFLGAAQLDRFANLNTTVVGPYDEPTVRLPGAGGASEIAACAKEVLIIVRQTQRTCVAKLDFVTSAGHLDGGDARQHINLLGKGPTAVITDLCVMEPDPTSKELTVVSLHPGVTSERVTRSTGWPVRFAPQVRQTPAPGPEELAVLRALQARTAAAHGADAASGGAA
jgi:glutaconate CoA-transferase subunit B